jgi:hypothetical protein
MAVKPSMDEQAGMAWWNSLTEPERAQALEAAGWKPNGTDTPSAADAWATHKNLVAVVRAVEGRHVQ